MTAPGQGGPLRVLFVESESHILGGGHLSLLTLVRNLDPARVDASVVTFGDGPFRERLQAAGCRVQVFSRRSRFLDPLLVLRLAWRARKADLVHVNTLDIRAGLAACLAGRPLVGHLRVIFPFTWIDRWFVRLSDRTIAVSRAVRDLFCRHHPELESKFDVIPNTVDVEASSSGDVRAELDLAPGTPLVGAVARIDPWKGVHTFVSAAVALCAERADVHFVIAGTHDANDPAAAAYSNSLRESADAAPGRIHFLGFRADAHSVIRQLDVLVVPSTVVETPEGEKTEGFGRVVIEAMALGRPVVATRVGGIPEIVRDGETGILIDRDNESQMVQALRDLLDQPALAADLASAGKADFEARFALAPHLDRILECYGSALHPHESQT